MMSMVILLFVFIGLIVAPRIGVDLFPSVNIPIVSVAAVYPGASPSEMESQVIKPLEEEIASLSNLKRLTSIAYEGRAIIVIEFGMSTDLDIAAIDVQKKVDGCRAKLPSDIDPPVVHKFDFNAQPVMNLAVSSPRPPEELYQIVRDQVKERLEQVPGVAAVSIMGGKEREIQILLDQYRLETYGLTVNQVIERLALENLNVPGGEVEQGSSKFSLRVLGEFNRLEDIEKLLLPLPGGKTIPLREVGQVIDTHKEVTRLARLDGKEAVGISIQKQSDASLVATADQLHREINQLKKALPSDVEILVATDASVFVRSSLYDTWRNLGEGIIMTALVLLLFLQEWRSTLIVLLAIPSSIVATLALIYFAGFTFNILSLMGLTMCIGILVDDSIVILENIYRHRTHLKKDPVQAAIDGRHEIGMAAVAITMSDVVVFAPIAFMSGMIGQFFKEFGFTVVFATLFSLFISFTLTPMLAARIFSPLTSGKDHMSAFARCRWPFSPESGEKFSARWKKIQHLVYENYKAALHWSLEHRKTVLLLCGLALLIAGALFPLRLVETEFLPRPDQGELTISVEMPPGTALQQTDQMMRSLEAMLAQMPETAHCYTTVGQSGEQYLAKTASYAGNIQLRLVPKNKRQRSVTEIAEEIRSWNYLFPGARITVFEPGMVGVPNMAPIQIYITGPDMTTLQHIAAQVQEIVQSVPGPADIDTSWRAGQPEIQVKINRLAAAEAGLSVAEIARTVRASLEGEIAARYREEGKEADIRVKVKDFKSADLSRIKELGITNRYGQIIRLEEVADISYQTGPNEIRRFNRQRLITIKANIHDRPLGEIMKDIKNKADQLQLPPGYQIIYEGETRDLEESFAELIQALLISITLVYAILVMLYESYLIPVIRMLSLPLGMVGALLALALTGKTLNIVSFIGLIMLDGLVAKNSTLLIDYTHTVMQREGLPLREALVEAGTTRLRPIIMTSVTMIAGMLPTALGLSTAGEIRSGMAIVLIGGLILSTLLTLIVIPVAYTLLDDFRTRLRNRKQFKKTT